MPQGKRNPETIPTGQGKGKERAIAAHERAVKALTLLRDGYTYRQIADALGYKSTASVHEAVQRLLKRLPKQTVEEMREIERERLDRFHKVLADMTENGGKMAPRAIEVAVRVSERRAKLFGLDAADKVEHDFKAPAVIEFVRDERQDTRRREVDELLGGGTGDEPVPADSGA